MRQVKEGFGISYLLELGYNIGSYTISGKLGSDALSEITGYTTNYPDISVTLENYFSNLQVGLFPKFNFGNFSIGIGGGIKIPVIEETKKLSRTDIAD